MNKPLIGKPVDRVDARGKVTGTIEYAADVPVANVAHAVIVTSGIGRGRVETIYADATRRMPGVLAVITP